MAAKLLASSKPPTNLPPKTPKSKSFVKVGQLSKSPFSLASVGLISLLTASSRVLGQVRATLWAAILSTSPLADVFLLAIKLPSLMRAYFAEGVMSSALVPTYSTQLVKLDKHKKQKIKKQEKVANSKANIMVSPAIEEKSPGEEFLQSIFALLLPALVVVIVVVLAAAPLITKFYFLLSNMSFSDDFKPEDFFVITSSLIRITFPYLFCISLASFFASIMQSHHSFFVSGFVPILFNIVNIVFAGFVFFARNSLTGKASVQILAIGFVVAGIVQMFYAVTVFYLWQKTRQGKGQRTVLNLARLFFVGSLYSFANFKRRLKNANINDFFKRLSPTAFSSLVMQINIVLLDPIALSLGSGTLAILFYSNRVAELPLGLLSYPLTMVTLPMLSRLAEKKDSVEISRTLHYAFTTMLLFLVPVVVLGIYFSYEVVQLLFQYGQFSARDSQVTAQTLRFYLFALPALASYRMLTSLFFASGNTVVPLRAALLSLVVSLSLAFVLTSWFLHPGAIAFASCISAYSMVAYLFWKSRVLLGQPLLMVVLERLGVYLLGGVFPFFAAWLFSSNINLFIMAVKESVLAGQAFGGVGAMITEKLLLVLQLGFFTVVFMLFYVLVLRLVNEKGLGIMLNSLSEK